MNNRMREDMWYGKYPMDKLDESSAIDWCSESEMHGCKPLQLQNQSSQNVQSPSITYRQVHYQQSVSLIVNNESKINTRTEISVEFKMTCDIVWHWETKSKKK